MPTAYTRVMLPVHLCTCDAGCTHEAFLKQMEVDDAFDAALTDVGIEQATTASSSAIAKAAAARAQLVVSSPLSRALHTADTVFPPAAVAVGCKRVVLESIREYVGWLVNGSRRPKSVLETRFEVSANSALSLSPHSGRWALVEGSGKAVALLVTSTPLSCSPSRARCQHRQHSQHRQLLADP